eukprot:2645209-Pyramimonas_sp.AAC.1
MYHASSGPAGTIRGQISDDRRNHITCTLQYAKGAVDAVQSTRRKRCRAIYVLQSMRCNRRSAIA